MRLRENTSFWRLFRYPMISESKPPGLGVAFGQKLPELLVGDPAIKHGVNPPQDLVRPFGFLQVEFEPVDFTLRAGIVAVEGDYRV